MRAPARAALAAAAALALAASIAIGCGGSGDSAEPGSGRPPAGLLVGNLVPLRGDLAAFGPSARKAADLAARQANAAARTAGIETTVEVRHSDTESNDQIAEVLALEMVKDGAGCLVGDWPTSGTFSVAGNVAVPEATPLISPASSSAELTAIRDAGLVFRTVPSDDLQARALAHLAAQSIGGASGRVLSIAARDDVYGRRFAERLEAAWRELDGAVLGPLLYDPGQPNHRRDASRILAGDPDAYAVVDFPDGFARLAADLLASPGYRPARLFLPDVLATDDVRDLDIAPAAVEGARGTLPGATAVGPGGARYERLFAASADPPARAADFSAQVYDAVTTCFLAAVAAGSSEGEPIARRLAAVSGPPGRVLGPGDLAEAIAALRAGEEIDYEGASGPVDFDESGDPAEAVYGVFAYRDGRSRDVGKIEVSGPGVP